MSKPRVQVLGPSEFLLMEDYSYRWDVPSDEPITPRTAILTAPAGFRFDMASVPRAVHAFIGRLDLGLRAPLFHDLLYHHGGRLPGRLYQWHIDGEWVNADAPWSRRDADRLFGRHMREDGVARWRRRAAYRAVRLFGGGSWRS
jgi:hypothetical protein